MGGFSPVVLDHFRHPRNAEALADPTHEGWSGDLATDRYMRIQLRLEHDVVAAASFATYGCAPAIAAGSLLCDWLLGKTPDVAATLTADTLRSWLGGLPTGREFCADLAVDALAAALKPPDNAQGDA